MRRLALLLALLPAPALAAGGAEVEAQYTPAYGRCLQTPGGETTAGIITCVGAELKVQDARLNEAYRRAMSGLNAGQRAKLQAAQRAWIAFRDADCRSLEDPDWGSLSRITANQCVLSRTVERTLELNLYPWGEDRD